VYSETWLSGSLLKTCQALNGIKSTPRHVNVLSDERRLKCFRRRTWGIIMTTIRYWIRLLTSVCAVWDIQETEPRCALLGLASPQRSSSVVTCDLSYPSWKCDAALKPPYSVV